MASNDTSPAVGFSEEKRISTPDSIPAFLSRARTARPKLSITDSLMSEKCSRVGSTRAPAPPLHRTRMPLRTHAARRSTLVLMLSMASITASSKRLSS